jgi:hypothetical protein
MWEHYQSHLLCHSPYLYHKDEARGERRAYPGKDRSAVQATQREASPSGYCLAQLERAGLDEEAMRHLCGKPVQGIRNVNLSTLRTTR